MGSSQSTKNNNEEEETLSRSKHRIQFIKQAICTRNAFFTALANYAICLKNTGAALSDGTRPDFSHNPPSLDSPPPPPPPPPPLSNLNNPPPDPDLFPPPPPLLPSFPPKYLRRSKRIAVPVVPPPTIMQLMKLDEEDEDEDEAEELTSNSSSISGGSDWDYFFGTEDVVLGEKLQKTSDLPIPPVRPILKKRGGEIRSKPRQPVRLKQIFLDVDDHFLKAFDSTLDVSLMLEATTSHHHSNFADNQPNGTEEIEILATLLDKILAWENKLYDEVNAGAVIKYEYQKTVSLLNKQKIQDSNPKSLAKLNTAISHLDTRYVVEMQSAVSTIAEINSIRDELLYQSLVQLVDGMERMWKTMLFHHESQAKIVYSLKSLGTSQLLKESSEYHYDCTMQLCGAVREWHTQFCGVIYYQKEFISALHNWSKLSVIPIESNLKENVSVSSPSSVQNSPLHALLVAWKNDLDQLPDEVVRNAIRNFSAVTQTIVHQQEEDLKTRERCKAKQKEHDCKKRTQFKDSYVKNGGNEELNPDNPLKDGKKERESAIISLKQQLEVDEEANTRVRKSASKKFLASLRYSLLEVFSAMSEIAQACSGMYHNLINIVEHQNALADVRGRISVIHNRNQYSILR